MSQKSKYAGSIGLVLFLLVLSACSAPATSTPTPDLNPFRTEVAATVYAEVTQALALTPSATPVPSATPTLMPTRTPTQAITTTATLTTTLSTGTVITGTNRAQWLFQSVADDTVFAPGETFSITWRVQNVGTATWTTAYYLRFFAGDSFGAPKEVSLSKEVLPGQTLDITLEMKAPANPGDYRTDWVLSNPQRSNFREGFYLKFKVALPATATPTSTSTPTSTPTATP